MSIPSMDALDTDAVCVTHIRCASFVNGSFECESSPTNGLLKQATRIDDRPTLFYYIPCKLLTT